MWWMGQAKFHGILIFEKEVIRSIFGHKDSWINFMECWFLVLRRKWFVRFLVIKIRGWNIWWMDRAKFHGILIFEKEVIRSIFGHKDSWINFMECWFLVLRRKWFVRFLIKIRGWNVWWMDQVKFHGILIFALQKKWFVWFLCLWRSSDLKVMWFLFDFCLWRFANEGLWFLIQYYWKIILNEELNIFN